MRYKNSSTLTGVLMAILLVIGIFYGGYFYIQQNASDAGVIVNDTKYSNIYVNLNESQTRFDDNIQTIKNVFVNNSIEEAGDIFQVALNGFKGLGAALLLPARFIDVMIAVFESMLTIDFIPGWANVLILAGLTGFILLLILKVLKGEPNL